MNFKTKLFLQMTILTVLSLLFRAFSSIHDGLSDRGYCFSCEPFPVVGFWAWHIFNWCRRDIWQFGLYIWQIVYIHRQTMGQSNLYVEDEVAMPVLGTGSAATYQELSRKIRKIISSEGAERKPTLLMQLNFILEGAIYLVCMILSNWLIHTSLYNWTVAHRSLFDF